MFRIQTFMIAGLLAAAIGSAQADRVPLGFLTAPQIAVAQPPEPTTVEPVTYISLHGGVMLTPNVGGLVGVDASIPGLNLGNGWHSRIDADVIFNAGFGGIDTIVPVTFDQLYYSPNGASGHNVYYGVGLGAILSGPVSFDGKLILGTEISRNFGAEVNLHLNRHDPLLTLFARLHM